MMQPCFAAPTLASWWVVNAAPRDRWWMLPVLAMQALGWHGVLAGRPDHVDASHRAFVLALGTGWAVARHDATRLFWAGTALMAVAMRVGAGRCPFDLYDRQDRQWRRAGSFAGTNALFVAAAALWCAPVVARRGAP